MLRHMLLLALVALAAAGAEEAEGVKYASDCEVCKIMSKEIDGRLEMSAKNAEVLRLGYSIDDDKSKQRIEYHKSELRLIEALDGLCERILRYSLHKEREDSTRFAEGMSETFQTLHGLADKGVKVELGIPRELWDSPPVEVTQLKAQCESLLEKYEDTITEWYYKLQSEKPLMKHLCEDNVLPPDERECLTERPYGKRRRQKKKRKAAANNSEL